jgi:hypothetical protein
MFKAGKCYETKSSEIVRNMAVTKFEGKDVSFDARKQIHKDAFHYVRSFSLLRHRAQRVLCAVKCVPLCPLLNMLR